MAESKAGNGEAVVTPIVTYSVTDAAIAAMRERFAGLTCETPEQYEETRLAIAETRGLRVAVEKRRVELKADALAYGRLVDSEAKRITASLTAIEEPLKALKQVVDDAAAKVKQDAEDAKRVALEAEVTKAREVEEARLKGLRDAEDARLAEERKALEVERAKLDEQRKAQEKTDADAKAQRDAEAKRLQDEAAKIDADRKALEAEQARVAAVEAERQAGIKADADAVAKAEQDRIDSLARQAEIAELLPDVEKVRAYAVAIRALHAPKVKAKKVKAMIDEAVASLACVASTLDTRASGL